MTDRSDLAVRVRRHLDEQVPPITMGEVTERRGPTTFRSAQHGSWTLRLGTAVILVFVIVVAVSLAARPDDAATVSSDPSTTVPSTQADPPGIQATGFATASGLGSITDILATPSHLLVATVTSPNESDVVAFDATSGSIAWRSSLTGEVGRSGIAATTSALWITTTNLQDAEGTALWRLDQTTGEVTRIARIDGTATIAANEGHVYVKMEGLTEIRPTAEPSTVEARVQDSFGWISSTPDGAWMVDIRSRGLTRIIGADAAPPVALDSSLQPSALIADSDKIVTASGGSLLRVDAATGATNVLATASNDVTDFDIADGTAWMIDRDDVVTAVDVTSGPLGSTPPDLGNLSSVIASSGSTAYVCTKPSQGTTECFRLTA